MFFNDSTLIFNNVHTHQLWDLFLFDDAYFLMDNNSFHQNHMTFYNQSVGDIYNSQFNQSVDSTLYTWDVAQLHIENSTASCLNAKNDTILYVKNSSFGLDFALNMNEFMGNATVTLIDSNSKRQIEVSGTVNFTAINSCINYSAIQFDDLFFKDNSSITLTDVTLDDVWTVEFRDYCNATISNLTVQSVDSFELGYNSFMPTWTNETVTFYLEDSTIDCPLYTNDHSRVVLNNSDFSDNIQIKHLSNVTILDGDFYRISMYENSTTDCLRVNISANVEVRDNSSFYIEDSNLTGGMTLYNNAFSQVINTDSTNQIRTELNSILLINDSQIIGKALDLGGDSAEVFNVTCDRLIFRYLDSLKMNNVSINRLSLYHNHSVILNGSDKIYSGSPQLQITDLILNISVDTKIDLRQNASINMTDTTFPGTLDIDAVGDPDSTLWASVNNSQIGIVDIGDQATVFMMDSIILDGLYLANDGLFFGDNVTIQASTQLQSAQPGYQLFENAAFEDIILLMAGRVNISRSSIVGAGILWLGFPDFGTFPEAWVEHSSCVNIRTEGTGNITTNNVTADQLNFFHGTHGLLENSTFENLRVYDPANVSVNNCVITNLEFDSPNLEVNNSIVQNMAPTPETLDPLLSDPADFLLNWTQSPGMNLTGQIVNYTIYRAVTARLVSQISDSDFTVLDYYEYPNPALSSNTTFYDDELNTTTSLEGKKIWYKVGILDEGGNHANSSVTYTNYQSSYQKIRASIFFDRSLTTYDDIFISILINPNDIDDDGSPDVDMVIMNYSNGITNWTVVLSGNPLYEEVANQSYNFTFATNYFDQVSFYVFINSSSKFDETYDYDSRDPENIGAEFLIERPDITFTDVNLPSDIEKIVESTTLRFAIFAIEDEAYVDNVTIFFRYNDEYSVGSWQSMAFDYNSTESKYTTTLPSVINTAIVQIDYYIVYYDTANNKTDLLGSQLQPESYDVFPLFPSFYLSDPLILFLIMIGSFAVGIVLGSGYLFFRRQARKESRREVKQMQKNIETHMKDSKAKKTSAEEKGEGGGLLPMVASEELMEPNVKKLNAIYGIGLAAFGVSTGFAMGIFLMPGLFTAIGFAAVFSLIPANILATLLMVLAMFLSFFMFIIWLYRDTKFSIRKEKVRMWRVFINFVHIIVFMAITILMLVVGSTIPWVNYYIVQQSGTPALPILGIPIHYLYLKIIGLALSTIVAFTLSVYWDVKKSIQNTQVYKKQNMNLSTILFNKEELIQKTYGRINYKILIFLVLLGVAVLPISADGFLSILPTALIIIGPAFLIFLLFFLVGFLQKSKLEPFGIVLEPVKTCPSCNTGNVQSALYCGNCRADLASDQLVYTDTITCRNCATINPIEYNYCKACGVELKPKKKQAKGTEQKDLPDTF